MAQVKRTVILSPGDTLLLTVQCSDPDGPPSPTPPTPPPGPAPRKPPPSSPPPRPGPTDPTLQRVVRFEKNGRIGVANELSDIFPRISAHRTSNDKAIIAVNRGKYAALPFTLPGRTRVTFVAENPNPPWSSGPMYAVISSTPGDFSSARRGGISGWFINQEESPKELYLNLRPEISDSEEAMMEVAKLFSLGVFPL